MYNAIHADWIRGQADGAGYGESILEVSKEIYYRDRT